MSLIDGFSTNIKVQFHEVDSMRIVHHSYYIYWMEIARFNFAKSIMGFTFQDFESMGFLLPVTKLESKYIRSATLGQNIVVHLKLIDRDEAIATFLYEMRDQETRQKIFEGRTEHAFINQSGKLLLNYPNKWMQALQEIKNISPSYIICNEDRVINLKY